MSEATTIPEEITDTESGFQVCHLFCCCDPDVSLCGIDMTGWPVAGPEEDDCAMCVLVNEKPCARCGDDSNTPCDIHNGNCPS